MVKNLPAMQETQVQSLSPLEKGMSAAAAAAAAAKLLQSCPTLRNPIDSSPPGSPVPGILQARTLERVKQKIALPIFLDTLNNFYNLFLLNILQEFLIIHRNKA